MNKLGERVVILLNSTMGRKVTYKRPSFEQSWFGNVGQKAVS